VSSDVELRECSDCAVPLPLTTDFFHRSNEQHKRGFQRYCKWCGGKRRRAWRRANRERDALNRKLLRGGVSVRAEKREEEAA
jgi:RNase P subunit RPR2